ncbi:MAG: hypothetical protein B7Y75_02455 [Azorhizobium sp. 35-67-5]|nr:MAG: hypothetical protein B7Y75_02455 [Azorhizobium sp. 35-67-5]
MKISATALAGVMHVEVTPFADDRGLFARTFCAETFAAHGMASVFPQANTSFNPRAGGAPGAAGATGGNPRRRRRDRR